MKFKMVKEDAEIDITLSNTETFNHLLAWLELESNLIIGHEEEIIQYYQSIYSIKDLVQIITDPYYFNSSDHNDAKIY